MLERAVKFFLGIMLILCPLQCRFIQGSEELKRISLEMLPLPEDQPVLNSVMSGLRMSDDPAELLSSIPVDVEDVRYFHFKVSHAADSLVSGLRGVNRGGVEIFCFDTDNDNDFSDESLFTRGSELHDWVFTVPLRFEESSGNRKRQRELVLEVKIGRRLEYHVKRMWHVRIVRQDDSLDVAVLRFLPDISLVFLDPDGDGEFDRIFNAAKEIFPFGGRFYRMRVDLFTDELVFTPSGEIPVDVGYKAPLFSGILSTGAPFRMDEPGRITLLFFSYAACSGTAVAMESLVNMVKTESLNSVRFVSISRDSMDVEEYHERFDFPFATLVDAAVWDRYGVVATPTIFIADREGVIRYRKTGAGRDEGLHLTRIFQSLMDE